MVDKKIHNTGFALLLSLIVVSVVLSVGLVILDLTIKQVRLAATTKDSEIAFNAANAGMECARYWRRSESTAIASGNPIGGVLRCFEQNVGNYDDDPVPKSGGGSSHYYEYDFTWGPGGDRCTRVDMIATTVPPTDTTAEIALADVRSRISGYPDPGGSTVDCAPGSQCTIISVRGYNRACPPAGGNFGAGVIERKVLLEF